MQCFAAELFSRIEKHFLQTLWLVLSTQQSLKEGFVLRDFPKEIEKNGLRRNNSWEKDSSADKLDWEHPPIPFQALILQ